jgi:Ser/Thr protein kinase RdoA (MazF antagonist)
MDTVAMSAKVHGMDGTLVEADWPPLEFAEVRALLARFPACGDARKILSVSPRPFSAASVVATENGRVFIKRHPRLVRDREGLMEEHRFMKHLLAHGAPVPRLFADDRGETAIEIGGWTYEVHEAPEAEDLYGEVISWTPFLTTAHAWSAGHALARLHRAAQSFAAPRRQPRLLVAGFTIFADQDPPAAMNRYFNERPALAGNADARRSAAEAAELLAPFHAQLVPLLPSLPSLWTHNDLHGSNLLWSDRSEQARAVKIIDFGLADRTNAVHDLAQAIERSIVEWLALSTAPTDGLDVPVHLAHLHALLAGYESLCPLSNEEAAALVPMTALCHAEFALTEADYFLVALHSEEKARVAYDEYLVGHARWYRSRGGQAFLHDIEQWAAKRGRKNDFEKVES